MYTGKTIFVKMKSRFIIYIAIILLGFTAIVSMSNYTGNVLKDNAQIISVLAKQRMLTQALAKDAYKISVLEETLSHSTDDLRSQEIVDQIAASKQLLQRNRDTYESVYTELLTGIVTTDSGDVFRVSHSTLKKIDPEIQNYILIWSSFRPSIDVILSSDSKESMDNALNYIDAENINLLNASEHILDTFESRMIEHYEIYQFILFILLFVTIAIAALLMYAMYDDQFKALNIFYSKFEKLGMGRLKHQTKSVNNFSEEVQMMVDGFSETLDLTEKINSNQSFSETLKYIFNSFNHYLPYTYIGIALLSDETPKTVIATYGIGQVQHTGLAEELLGYEAILEDTSLGQIMSLKEPRIINDVDSYFETRPVNQYSKIVMDFGIRSSVTLPLSANGMPLGFIFFSSDQKNVYEPHHIEFLKIISNSIALSFQKNIFMDELLYSSVLALAKLSEARDEDTGEHLIRMANYVELIANELKKEEKYETILTREYIDNLVKFSPMHDIGKVGIPDHILLKPAKLTFDEFEVMKTHTVYGANVLKEAENNINRRGRSLFTMGIEIALNHHEKFDGSGYPNGISGDAIPLSARIVAVADVFDALMSKRPYKEPFSFDETMKIILDGKGKHFDPMIVDALVRVFSKEKDLTPLNSLI
ncbi:MAG: hypothetical protein BGO41_03935 [Clostridiales bacterium 38-18]|nr:MAG: hypothetical protein BGO41_03935 [Clostridiales bacterium 38-18]